jgi:FixJ family two-component response regulator
VTDGPRVFVVDDDEVVLLSVQALLDQHGWTVQCYSSAARFLSDAPITGPGCVVTDLQMPGMSGVELHNRLQKANSPLSVVVVTGVAEGAARQTLLAGGAMILEKPYTRGDLLQAIQSGLAASARRYEARRD